MIREALINHPEVLLAGGDVVRGMLHWKYEMVHDLFERIVPFVVGQFYRALKEIENDTTVLHILGKRGDAEFVVLVKEFRELLVVGLVVCNVSCFLDDASTLFL